MQIWRMTRRSPVPPREHEWLQSATSTFESINRRTIRLHEWGNKSDPTVFLVHGWGGRGAQMAAFASPLAQSGHRVIAFDLPGHGESSGRATDMFECHLVLQALRERYGTPRAVIAHSFGGMVATFAMRQNLGANRVVLIGTPSDGNRVIAGYINWLSVPTRISECMLALVKKRLGDDVFDQLSPEFHAPHIKTPCLIIHDEEDLDVPIAAAERVEALWEGAKLVRTSKLGHRRILRDEGVVQRANEFICGSQALLSRSQSRQVENKDS